MNRYVLGISAFYHDAAAAIIRNGELIAAAQEERFTRRRHDASFPYNAINYCLEEAGIESEELSMAAFYDDPTLSFDRIIRTSSVAATEKQFNDTIKSFLSLKPYAKEFLEDMIKCKIPFFYARHHYSHAASAFFPSPFSEAAILCVDGVGEWATTSIAYGKDESINMITEIRFPHSLGLLYSAFTKYCGFKVNSGEYKLMGLAPYGIPKYISIIKDNLIDIKNDGSFRLNLDYFDYVKGSTLCNQNFHRLFSGEPRKPESLITQKDMDLAASIQLVTEEIMLKLSASARKITNCQNLCMAGGVALNCVANGKIVLQNKNKDLWIQPAAGDAGGAIGAAFLGDTRILGSKRILPNKKVDNQKGSLLGPKYNNLEIKSHLDNLGAIYKRIDLDGEGVNEIANLLSKQKIVAVFSDRMEFGPRSLGARSILGDPRAPETQQHMNLKIKFRESFRPFAPIVIEKKACDYFDLYQNSPYMLLVAPIKSSRRLSYKKKSHKKNLLEIVKQSRSDIPAVTHVDYSARVQTVPEDKNSVISKILLAFEAKTGCPVLVNTSFNVRGEPIVCTPEDAYRCFLRTEIDALLIGDFLLINDEQVNAIRDEDWKDEFKLD